jgi:hypothetical protein
MDTHLTVPPFNPTSSDVSAPSSRASSRSREGRSGAAGNAPRSRSNAAANTLKKIRQDLTRAIKECTEGIRKNKNEEALDLYQLDHIDCSEDGGYAKAIQLAGELVDFKKNAVQIYDVAIDRLLRISNKVNSEGIELSPEQNRKLDNLPQYLLHRERAAASLAAFEAFHLMLQGESCREEHDDAAAQEKYTAAVDRLIELPRENWSLQLRSSDPEIPSGSPWTLGAAEVNVLDVKKLLEIAITYESPERQQLEADVETKFSYFHQFFSILLTGLEKITPDEDDLSEQSASNFISYVKDMADALDEPENLQQTRNGIAYLKQAIVRLDIETRISGHDDIRNEASDYKRRYGSEALTMASTVLKAQHIHLQNAQFSFALSPETGAVLDQVQEKLDELVSKHPHKLDGSARDVDVSKLSQNEKEQMYGELSILPNADNEAARHLRYLIEDLALETVTENNKDIPLLIGLISGMADDLEQAARLAEAMLGELILAGVSPQSQAASEGSAEEWRLQLAYSDDEGKDTSGPVSPGFATPTEPGSKRSSLIRARANSLIDFRRLSLLSLEQSGLNEIDKAKAYSKPIEANMALMARQAESSKRDAAGVLANLREGIVGGRNRPNAIYELLNLAADRNSDRLKDIRKIIARWERIEDPTDEVTQRIFDLTRSADECEAEIRTLREQAVQKTADGIEQDPSAEGALFLHRHGLIERIDRPAWVMFPRLEYDHHSKEFVQRYTSDRKPMVEYLHEWLIRVKPDPGTDRTFTIYAHDHKKCDIEDPHPEALTESNMVTWKNHFYHDKGKLWEQRMVQQGWSPEVAKVQRRFSNQQAINELARHYIEDEADRVPDAKRPRRLGRQ